jgi:hypothetical protein
MLWKAIVSSSIGTSHRKNGTPCQDAGNIKVLQNRDLVIGAVSDGAGSATYSEQGSSLAINTVLEYLENQCSFINSNDENQLEEILRNSVQHTRSKIEEFAAAQKLPLQDFACTLLVFFVTPKQFSAAQIGDGLIIVRREQSKDYEMIFSPDKGEYANMTTFITSPNFVDDLQIMTLFADDLKFIFLSTDGLERLAAEWRNQEWTPYRDFLYPLEEHICREPDLEIAQNKLTAFLDSEKISMRTDDDKTALLCYNVSSLNQDFDWVEEMSRLSRNNEQNLLGKLSVQFRREQPSQLKAPGNSVSLGNSISQKVADSTSTPIQPSNIDAIKQPSVVRVNAPEKKNTIIPRPTQDKIFGKKNLQMSSKILRLEIREQLLKKTVLIIFHHGESENFSNAKVVDIVRQGLNEHTQYGDCEFIIQESLPGQKKKSSRSSQPNPNNRLETVIVLIIFFTAIIISIIVNLEIIRFDTDKLSKLLNIILTSVIPLLLILIGFKIFSVRRR